LSSLAGPDSSGADADPANQRDLVMTSHLDGGESGAQHELQRQRITFSIRGVGIFVDPDTSFAAGIQTPETQIAGTAPCTHCWPASAGTTT
jgi:hypothetical protein